MKTSKRVLSCISHVSQLAADLKSVNVQMPDREEAMKVLCWLQTKFAHFIVAINAIADDNKLTLEFLRRWFQE